MVRRTNWASLRDRRMSEPRAQEAYAATELAFELGRAVRQLREQRGWSQGVLARATGMSQSAIARFETGGTIPTLPILNRLADALDAELVIQVKPRADVA